MKKRLRKKLGRRRYAEDFSIALLLDKARQNIAIEPRNPLTFNQAWRNLQGALNRLSNPTQTDRRCVTCKGPLTPFLFSWICPACDLPPHEVPDAAGKDGI